MGSNIAAHLTGAGIAVTLLDIVPKSLIQTYMHSNTYLTQGYYHLGLALDIDFTTTYFFGSNPASLNFGNSVLGLDLWEKTYMFKLYKEKGVSDIAQWHSAYMWFANDVSFFGVPIILFLLGFFSGYAYKITILNNDLLSSFVFVMLINIQIFLFANNSFLAQYYYSFVMVFIIWLFTRVLKLK